MGKSETREARGLKFHRHMTVSFFSFFFSKLSGPIDNCVRLFWFFRLIVWATVEEGWETMEEGWQTVVGEGWEKVWQGPGKCSTVHSRPGHLPAFPCR